MTTQSTDCMGNASRKIKTFFYIKFVDTCICLFGRYNIISEKFLPFWEIMNIICSYEYHNQINFQEIT